MEFRIEVWGDHACFTRPEFGNDRVSYPVMTPSAARGLIEQIYWHPGMKWKIDAIQVVNPVRYTGYRTSEFVGKLNSNYIIEAMVNRDPERVRKGKAVEQMLRSNSVLADVRYVIDAHYVIEAENPRGLSYAKVDAIVTRRLEKGQCWRTPYLGMSDYPAFFRPVDERPEPDSTLLGFQDLGIMLKDFDYSGGRAEPMFFHCVMEDGLVTVPEGCIGEENG